MRPMETPGKKVLPPDLEEDVYGLWAVYDWSYEKISKWLAEKHQFTASREWVRRLIDRMKLAKGGVAADDADPGELDDDQQLVRVQHDAYREARSKLRRGDTSGWAVAARVHLQVVLTRKKLREPGPAAGDAQEPVQDVGLRLPMFGAGVVINGRS